MSKHHVVNYVSLLFKSLTDSAFHEHPRCSGVCLFVESCAHAGSLTFSAFPRGLLLTFLFDMLSYLRLGNTVRADKGQTWHPDDRSERSDTTMRVGGRY